MGTFVKCFDIEELEALDDRQIKLLKEAIERELANSPEVRSLLRKKMQPMYDRLSSQNKPSGSSTP